MADQNFRVKNGLEVGIGGSIISTSSANNIGIGTTNPTSRLTVRGDTLVSGVVTAAAFYGSGIGLTGLNAAPSIISDVELNSTYYPLLSPASSGTISTISVSSTSIVFNPALNYLGIGTTNPTTYLDLPFNSSTQNTVQFGAFGIQGFDNGNGFISVNGYWNGNSWVYRKTGYTSLIQFLNGDINWRTVGIPTSGTAGAGTTTQDIYTRLSVSRSGSISLNKGGDTSNSPLLLDIRRADLPDEYPYVSRKNPFLVGVTTNGEVGIATTNPTSKLSVVGDGYFTGVITATAFYGNVSGSLSNQIQDIAIDKLYYPVLSPQTSGSISSISVSSNSIVYNPGTNSLGIGTTNPLGIIQVGSGSTTNMFIVDYFGHIGVGTTRPQGALHIKKQTTPEFLESHVDLILENTGAGNARFFLKTLANNKNWEFFADDTDGSFGIYDGVSRIRRWAIKNDGLIGLNTNVSTRGPRAALEVFRPSVGVTSTSVGFGTTQSFFAITNDNWSGQGDILHVDRFGNTGIGTTNPTSRLTVRGDTLVSGVVTAAAFYGSGIGVTGLVQGTIYDVASDQLYYPILSDKTTGTISSVSVSSRSIVFNPALNFLGIGTTNPQAPLDVWTGDGFVRFGDVTDINQTTDNGLAFIPSATGISQGGLTSYRAALFTEVNGRLLSYGVNVVQLESVRDTNFAGGIFRIDTRNTGGWADSNVFVVKRQPVGLATTQGAGGEQNGIVINLNTGNTYLTPNGGRVFVGTGNPLSTEGRNNIRLQVGAASTPQDAYISGRVGIGTTDLDTYQLNVGGSARISGIVSAAVYYGSGIGLTGIISGEITDTNSTNIFYPLLSSTISGTISSVFVSSQTLAFNPGTAALGIRTNNPTSALHFAGIGTVSPTGDNSRFRIGDYHWDNVYTTIHAKKVRSEWWLEQNSDDTDGVDMIFYKSRGWPNQETPVQLGDNVFRLTARTYKPGRTGIGSNITLSDWSGDSAGQIEFNVDQVTVNNALCSMDFKTASTSRLLITSFGNVGIASTLPRARFDVRGNSIVTGVLTATQFVGDGSLLTGIVASGSGVQVRDDNVNVGTAATLNFGVGLAVSFVNGVATIDGGAFGAGAISNVIQDIDDNRFYYPLLSPVTSGTISSISVSSQSIVFNPATNSLGIGTTNPVRLLHVLGYGITNGIRLGDMDFFNFGIGQASGGSPTFRSGITNGDTVLRVVPNGNAKAQFEFFGNDYFAPGISTQWVNVRINLVKNQTEFRIDTSQAQDKDVKPLVFEVGGHPNTDIPGLNPYQLYLSTEGKVGIGTSLPSARFTVQGDGRFIGVVTATAFVGSGSGLTGLNAAPSVISNIDNNAIYYPLLSPVSSGTISTISVSASSIVFNPGLDRLGIGTTNPISNLHFATPKGDITFGDIPEIPGTTDSVLSFVGSGSTNRAAIFTETNRLSFGFAVNVGQISTNPNLSRVGGIVRLETRTESETPFPLASSFDITGFPIGASHSVGFGIRRFNVNLNDGMTYLVPNGGNVGIGTTVTPSKLTVSGDGRFTGIVSASGFVGSGVGLTGLVSGEIVDVNNNAVYYPLLANKVSGTISSVSVASSSIVFNPATNALSIGTTISIGNTTTGSLTLGGKVTFGDGITNPNLTNAVSLTVGTGYSAYRSFNLVDSSAAVNIIRVSDSFGSILDLKQWNAGITTMLSYYDVTSELGLFGIRDRLGEYPPIGGTNRPSRTRLFINEFGNVLIGANASALQTNRTQTVAIGTANMLQVASGNVYVAGNIGVGKTNPANKVDVSGNVSATGFIGDGSNLTGVVNSIVAGENIVVNQTAGSVTINATLTGSSKNYWVPTNAGIHTLGNVGVGTTNPTASLEVSGNTILNGNLTVYGTSELRNVAITTTYQDITLQSGMIYAYYNPVTQLTLPSNPFTGDIVTIINRNNVGIATILRNGSKIMGLSEDLTVDIPNIAITLIYADSIDGWILGK